MDSTVKHLPDLLGATDGMLRLGESEMGKIIMNWTSFFLGWLAGMAFFGLTWALFALVDIVGRASAVRQMDSDL